MDRESLTRRAVLRTGLLGLGGLAALGALAGCRVQPLYGTVNPIGPVDSYSATQDLDAIEIRPIPDRLGQLLYNALRNEIVPRGLPAQPAYALEVEVNETVSSRLLRTDATATRALISMTTTYRLTAPGRRPPVLLLQDRATTLSAYNIGESEYATYRAEIDARERAVEELATRVRQRLASWFVEARADGTLARKLYIGE